MHERGMQYSGKSLRLTYELANVSDLEALVIFSRPINLVRENRSRKDSSGDYGVLSARLLKRDKYGVTCEMRHRPCRCEISHRRYEHAYGGEEKSE